MTNQAKNTVEKMLAAGFKRSEFSVTTARKVRRDHATGRSYSEWGLAQVYVRGGAVPVAERLDAILAQRLGVRMFIRGGKPFAAIVVTDYEMQGKVTRTDLDQMEKLEAQTQ